MTRKNNWQTLLDGYIAANALQPFAWHGQNCSTFAADWVRIATGRPVQVPATATAREALRTVRGLGGLRQDACRQLGEPVPGPFACVGDVALVAVPRSRGRVVRAFGICLGAVVAAPGPRGLLMLPITEAEAAWRV